MNTKWLFNTSRSHPTSQQDTFYVIIWDLISVTFESGRSRNWPFLLQVDVAEDWNGSTTTNTKMNTKWLGLKTHFIPIDIWVIGNIKWYLCFYFVFYLFKFIKFIFYVFYLRLDREWFLCRANPTYFHM